MKVETVIFEYEHCGECPHPDSSWVRRTSKLYCTKINPERLLKRTDLWGKIPDWCPLPDKEEV